MKNRQIAFQNETKRQNTKSVDYLDIGNGVFVIPYSLISGAVNLSEKGIETETTTITEPRAFLQTVFTGKDAINVCWDNSTYLTPNVTQTNYFDYNFKVGDYFYGKPITGQVEGGAEISQVEGNDDFLAMKSSQSITIQFEYEQPITGNFYEYSVYLHHLVPNDLYKRKLYRIPQIGENKWFYISNAQPVFADNSPMIIGSIVTFETVLDKLQSTGRAVEQYIQNGAPGEPRAVPKLEYEFDESGVSGVYLTVDENEKKLDTKRLIRYVQTELQGAGGYCGCMVYGRKLTQTGDIVTSQPWEMLFPHEFYQFNTNPINKTSVPSSTYNFLPDYKLSMNITSDMLEAWKKVQDSLSTCQCAGKIYLGVKGDWDGDITSGIHPHKSNKNNVPYWDPAWLPLSESGITTRSGINMGGSPYTSSTASFLNTDTFKSLFIKNTFICMNNPQLPVEISFSKPYHLSNFPIIGKIITPWIGDRTLFANKTNIPQEGIGMFIDKSYLNQIVGLTPRTSGTNDIYAFLSSLGGEMVPKGFGATSYNTSMCWKLTDLLGDGKQTVLLGQKKYVDGTWISGDHKPYTMDLTQVITTQDSQTGYVIDRIVLFSEFSGNVRFSFYNADMKSQYATTIISSTKFLDNSYNNYMTMVNFGTWPEMYISPNYRPIWPENYGDTAVLDFNYVEFNDYTDGDNQSAGTTQHWVNSYTRREQAGAGQGERYNFFGNKKTSNAPTMTSTIGYSNLGIEGVTDRTTLFDLCDKVRFHFNGTHLKFKSWVFHGWEDTKEETLGDSDYATINLVNGTYSYNADVSLIGVNTTNAMRNISLPNRDFCSLSYKYQWDRGNYSQPAKYTQIVNVSIEFLESNIVISIIFKSTIEQIDAEGSIIDYTEGGTQRELYMRPNKTTWSNNNLTINSNISLKYISFVKRV